jgi:2-polyprenyl-3-methyl-5-hydroxy-6-metoxy-1,4-benzoquinol methylase
VPPFTGERVDPHDEDFHPDLVRHLAAYRACLPFVTDKVVLDGGCGEGYGAKWMAGRARVVLGVDRSLVAMREARASRPKNARFVCADLTNLSFPDATFDVLCSLQVLEHFRHPAEFLREMARVLRPDGVLVLSTPNQLTSFSENPYHFKEYRPDELRELLESTFTSVRLAGLVGSERVDTLESSRRRHVEAILKLDRLGLRRMLPAPIREWAFAKLARVVRARIRRDHAASFRGVGVEDFTIASERIEDSLDLIAVCGK